MDEPKRKGTGWRRDRLCIIQGVCTRRGAVTACGARGDASLSRSVPGGLQHNPEL